MFFNKVLTIYNVLELLKIEHLEIAIPIRFRVGKNKELL